MDNIYVNKLIILNNNNMKNLIKSISIFLTNTGNIVGQSMRQQFTMLIRADSDNINVKQIINKLNIKL